MAEVNGMTVSVTLELEFDSALTDPNSEEYLTASQAVIDEFLEVAWLYLKQTHR